MTTPKPTDSDPRLDALRCALREHAIDPASLIARHPDREGLEAELSGPPLAAVLEDELATLESTAGLPGASRYPNPHPAAFWLRRRELTRWNRFQRDTEGIPATWLRILRLPAKTVSAGATRLGLDVVALIAATRPADQAIDWLAPLGSRLARRVADTIARRRPTELSSTARESIDRAYASLGRERRKQDLVAALGRRGLATSLDGLPADVRRRAASIAKSNLLDVLGHTPPFRVETADRTAIDRLVERRFTTEEARR